jgi:hypothetical protein
MQLRAAVATVLLVAGLQPGCSWTRCPEPPPPPPPAPQAIQAIQVGPRERAITATLRWVGRDGALYHAPKTGQTVLSQICMHDFTYNHRHEFYLQVDNLSSEEKVWLYVTPKAPCATFVPGIAVPPGAGVHCGCFPDSACADEHFCVVTGTHRKE